MGNKKKFDEIGRNDAYYEAYGEEVEEKQDDNKAEKKEKKEKKSIFKSLDSDMIPEKKTPSERFTYKREKRKIVHEDNEEKVVDLPRRAPYIFSLIVLCLVLAMNFVLTSKFFLSLDETTSCVAEVLMYVTAYFIPCVVYLVLPCSQKNLHNIRRFSVSTLSFAAANLGLMICLTALQKYMIAYTFSYSQPSAVMHGSIWFSLLTGALLPAICEELFVRGILQYEISEYAGGLCGVLVSAFVFAMLHFELQYFMIYFTGGLILGAVTHVTRSVFPAMAVHFLNNLLSMLLIDKLSFVATERIGGVLLIIILASMCFGFLILTLHLAEKISEKRVRYYLAKENEGQHTEEKNTFFVLSPDKMTGKKLLKVIMTPGMLVSFVVFLVIVFINL